MSGANSIHGIVLVGAMLIAADGRPTRSASSSSLVAVAFATMNVVGGYVVTDRMLQMFRKKPVGAQAGRRRRGGRLVTTLEIVEILVRIAWLVGAVGVRASASSRMNSPATARNGNLVSAGGMTIAIVATAILILARQPTGERHQRRSPG